MNPTTLFRKTRNKQRLSLISAVLIIMIFFVGQAAGPASAATINELQDQVSSIQAEITANNAKLSAIQSQKQTLQNKVYSYDLEISNINKHIDITKKKIESLNLQISDAQKELDKQSNILAEALRELYKNGNVTTIELLASSNSYTDFITSQEHLSRLKASIQDSVDKVKDLKKQLETDKGKQQNLAEELDGQKSVAERKRSEQAQLLAETQGEESKYQSILANNQSQLEKAKAQLIAAIIASQTNTQYGGTGGYPWANAGGSSWTFYGCWGPDLWGMCERQCVSYTAWKVHEDYLLGKVRFDMPYWGGMGNASEWPQDARNWGIPTGTTPKVGAVAINPYVACGGGFCYGHAMYVEALLPNGDIWVSQYNAQATGIYSQAEVSPAGLTFIYFQDW